MKQRRRELTTKEIEHIANIMMRRRAVDVANWLDTTERNLSLAWDTKRMTPDMINTLMAATPEDIQKTTKKKRTIRQESRPVVLPRGCFA